MVDEFLERSIPHYFQQECNFIGLVHWIKSKFDLEIPIDEISSLLPDEVVDFVNKKLKSVYQEKEAKAGLENMRQMEKTISLWVVDSRWKEHLLTVDHLREGIHLRAHAHVDPLVEYQKESYFAFQEMVIAIKEGIAELAFRTKIAPREEVGVFANSDKKFIHSQYTPLDKGKEKPPLAPKAPIATKKVGRNEPCLCGSGKKYKKCCGK